jgi:hypothetical protein
LKNDGTLYIDTNIEECVKTKPHINQTIKEKRILRDDRVIDFIDEIQTIIKTRKIKIIDTKKDKEIDYDIDKKRVLKRILYNYLKLNHDFLLQDKDLITFLKLQNIEKAKLLGVFVRMIKNFSSKYNMDNDDFIKIENRIYKKVLAK